MPAALPARRIHTLHAYMRRKIPPLQTLLCFDAAARHESYTRAAQELGNLGGAAV